MFYYMKLLKKVNFYTPLIQNFEGNLHLKKEFIIISSLSVEDIHRK